MSDSKPTVIVTFIRHGESLDNLRSVWAGWADAPLSVHGMNQARAMGEYFAKQNTRYAAIYASPLKRAASTAQALYDAHSEPKPTFTKSLLIREQHFGIGEGKPWTFNGDDNLTLEEQFARGIFPVLKGDDERFPGGESLNDLGERANQAISDLILPHVRTAALEGLTNIHVAVVSHGLCIGKLVEQLLLKDSETPQTGDFRGLLNTAWTRVEIRVRGQKEAEKMALGDGEIPPLKIRCTLVNQHSHINAVKRQQGGIGSSAYDPNQTTIRDFFGGKTGSAAEKEPVEALPVSESNAHDEVEEDRAPSINASQL